MNGKKHFKPLFIKKFLGSPYPNAQIMTKNSSTLLYCLRYYNRFDSDYFDAISSEILTTKSKMPRGSYLRNFLSVILHFSVAPSIAYRSTSLPKSKFKQEGRTAKLSKVDTLLKSLALASRGESLNQSQEDFEASLKKILSEYDRLTLQQSAVIMQGLVRANQQKSEIWLRVLSLTQFGDLPDASMIDTISILTSLGMIRIFKLLTETQKSLAEDAILKLKQALVANKEVLSVDEAITALYFLKKLERLDLEYLAEFEAKLAEKAHLIKFGDFMKVSRIYRQVEITPSRATFLKEVKTIFARKLEEGGEHIHVSEFLDFETELQMQGVRTSLASNTLVENSFLSDNIELFKALIVAKIRGQPYLAIGQQCFLIQSQVLTRINAITPKILEEIVRFFSVHGEISNEFAEKVLQAAQKALKDQSFNKKLDSIYWLLIIQNLFAVKKQLASKVKINLAEKLLETISNHLQVLPPALWIEAFSSHVWKKQLTTFEADFFEKLAGDFDHLSDESKIMVTYTICGRLKHEELSHVAALFVEDSYTVFSTTELCYVLPFILNSKEIAPDEKTKVLQKIFSSKLSLPELRAILQNLSSLPEEFMKDVYSKLQNFKKVETQELEMFLEVFEIVLTDSKRFDAKLCKQLLALISQKNYLLSQKKLDHLIDLYTQRNIKR